MRTAASALLFLTMAPLGLMAAELLTGGDKKSNVQATAVIEAQHVRAHYYIAFRLHVREPDGCSDQLRGYPFISAGAINSCSSFLLLPQKYWHVGFVPQRSGKDTALNSTCEPIEIWSRGRVVMSLNWAQLRGNVPSTPRLYGFFMVTR